MIKVFCQIYCVVLLLGTTELFAQVSMYLDSGSVWSVDDYKYFTTGKDTVIDSLTYTVISMVNDSIIDADSASVFAFVRQDTISGKVYRLLPNSNPGLIYDFNVQVDDTVVVYPWDLNFSLCANQPMGVIVTAIDSIKFNGVFHRKFDLEGVDYYYSPEYWIEGIGSSFGLFGGGIIDCDGADLNTPSLLCFRFLDSVIVVVPDNGCYRKYNPSVHIAEPNRIEETYVFPNPSSNIMYIDSDRPSLLKLFSSDGRLISITRINNYMDVSDLPMGLYSGILIGEEEGLYGWIRFVKE